jgi:tetratricopeptide (TPR) repeat protein
MVLHHHHHQQSSTVSSTRNIGVHSSSSEPNNKYKRSKLADFFIQQLKQMMKSTNVYENEKQMNLIMKQQYTLDEYHDLYNELLKEAHFMNTTAVYNSTSSSSIDPEDLYEQILINYAYMDRRFEYWNRVGRVETVSQDDLSINNQDISRLDQLLRLKVIANHVYNNLYVVLLNMNGMLLHMLNRFEEAMKSFEKAIAKDKYYAYSYINTGIVLCYMMKYEEAVQVLTYAIELDPSENLGYFWRSVCNRINQKYLNAYLDAMNATMLEHCSKNNRLYSDMRDIIHDHCKDNLSQLPPATLYRTL